MSKGKQFRDLIIESPPLQVVGAINAFSAIIAERAGFKALYISGAGVANASYGLPDIGITSLDNVLIDLDRITDAVDLPVLVDIDTGWGGAFNIARTIKKMITTGAAAIHMEDQVANKRCGHRPNKAIVSTNEMVDRIKAAVDARTDESFVIMARTDALASEGLAAAIDRSMAYIEAGADMIFPEAFTELAQYQQLVNTVKVPTLANLTEFGQTPLFTLEELHSVGVGIALYPLGASRAMFKAAETVYQTIRATGTQASMIDHMQTREELYDYLNYTDFENKLDELYDKEVNE